MTTAGTSRAGPAGPVRRSSPFAAVLRRLRRAAGVTQAELAERAGLGVRTVSNLERGINTSPYPSTVRLIADALDLDDGARAELVHAARVRPPTGRPRPVGNYLGSHPQTRLVARERELATVRDAFDAVMAGAGRVLLLAGEPGIGKTRLAQQVTVDAESEGFRVATGRCYQLQSDAPYTPWYEALAALHATSPPAVRDGLADRWPPLAALLPDHFPPRGPAPGADPEAAQRLPRAVVGYLRELASERPVAILLDDLHWADGASLDLLAHVARHVGGAPVLLVGTYRDVEVGRTHQVRQLAHTLHRDGTARTLHLGRLDAAATVTLITDRLDDDRVPDDLGALVHRHAGGNPFFTVEILLALIERGDLFRVDGEWARRDLVELAAPDNVTAAIHERVALLSAPARALLEAASVLGEAFDLTDLEELAGEEVGGDLVEEAFDETVAAGLLAVSDERPTFDHALTQHALYAALSPVRRRRLHRRIGERLESRPPAVRLRRAAELARHLEAAGLPDRAVAPLLDAGDAAAAAYAHDEALRLFEHARTLATAAGDGAGIAAALERVGRVELTIGRYDDAVGHLADSADGHLAAGDVAARLRVEGTIAEAQHRRGHGEAAAARLAAVVGELDTDLGSGALASGGAALGMGLARVRLALGQHELCFEATQQAARLARNEDDAQVEADAHAIAGTALLFLDRPGDAVDALERAIAVATDADAIGVEIAATLALQWVTTMRGDLTRARTLGHRGLALARRAGNADAEALHAANFGLTHFYGGDWTAAREHLERSVELARAGAPTLFSGIPPAYLGVLRASVGDTAGAAACYDEAATARDLQTFAFSAYLDARRAELALREGDPGAALARLEPWLTAEAPSRLHDVMLLSVAAEACLAAGDVERGGELADRAVRRAAATGNAVDGIDADRLRCRWLVLSGRAEEALATLHAVLARSETVPHPAARARTHGDLAAAHRALGDRSRAEQHLASALEISRGLGAAPDLAVAGATADRRRVGG